MRDETKAAILVGFLFLFALGGLFFFPPANWTFKWRSVPLAPISEPTPPSQVDQFLARYGPPTREEVSPHGSLRPPLFTRWFDYEPEHIRVAFVAAADPSSPGERRWVLICFLDGTRTIPLSPEEAANRLKSRRK